MPWDMPKSYETCTKSPMEYLDNVGCHFRGSFGCMLVRTSGFRGVGGVGGVGAKRSPTRVGGVAPNEEPKHEEHELEQTHQEEHEEEH